MDTQFCVYIMTDEQHTLLYTGRTSNLKRRVAQHRSGNGGMTTRRHGLTKLVYYEPAEDALAAKLRERQIKRCNKKKRLSLIAEMNPDWVDLFEKIRISTEIKYDTMDTNGTKEAFSTPGVPTKDETT